ncbi:hypothetical protein C0991_006409 [Blastosporella zonata]|nr:hypothetical protein C0991_006409 [Blastosporella zonata]
MIIRKCKHFMPSPSGEEPPSHQPEHTTPSPTGEEPPSHQPEHTHAVEISDELANASVGFKRKYTQDLPSPTISLDKLQLFTEDNPPPAITSPAVVASNLICNIKTIKCENEVYTVIREIFRLQSLTGRATCVWEAFDSKNNLVIVKESWILEGRKQTEFNFLQGLDAPQIPKIHTLIQVGFLTAKIRNILAPNSPDKVSKHREKRRIIETPVCVPLMSVWSHLELLGVFLDFVKAIHFDEEELLNDAIGILSKAGCRRGIVIDYDYGSFIVNPQDPLSPAPGQTDSQNGSTGQTDSQNGSKHPDFGVRTVKALTAEGAILRGTLPTFIAKWFSRSMELETLGKIKTAQFHGYLEKTLKQVTAPFSSIVPTLQSLWRALYPDHDPNMPPQDCCEEFIAILEGAIIAEGSSAFGLQAPSPTTSSSSMDDHAEETASKRQKLGNHAVG